MKRNMKALIQAFNNSILLQNILCEFTTCTYLDGYLDQKTGFQCSRIIWYKMSKYTY